MCTSIQPSGQHLCFDCKSIFVESTEEKLSIEVSPSSYRAGGASRSGKKKGYCTASQIFESSFKTRLVCQHLAETAEQRHSFRQLGNHVTVTAGLSGWPTQPESIPHASISLKLIHQTPNQPLLVRHQVPGLTHR
jgi:hypothetical protein